MKPPCHCKDCESHRVAPIAVLAVDAPRLPYVTYMHPFVGKGRVTMALEIQQDGDKEKVTVGVAFCSPKDQFCRKFGRLRASARLTRVGHVFTFKLKRGERVKEVAGLLLNSLLQSNKLVDDQGVPMFQASLNGDKFLVPRWADGEAVIRSHTKYTESHDL